MTGWTKTILMFSPLALLYAIYVKMQDVIASGTMRHEWQSINNLYALYWAIQLGAIIASVLVTTKREDGNV